MLINKKNASLEIHFNFYCRTTYRYENGENPIILRIKFRGQRKDVFTGITCPKKYWVATERIVSYKYKAGAEINRQLENIVSTANQAFQKLKFSG